MTTITCHDGPVNTLAFGADPSVVYSGGTDGTTHRWEWGSRESHSTELINRGEGNVTALSLDDCARYLLSGYSDGRIEVVDLLNEGENRVLHHHSDLVSVIVQHPNENVFISGSYDGNLTICDYPTGTVRQIVRDLHEGIVTGISFMDSGDQFSTSGLLSPVLVWDMEYLRAIRSLGLSSTTVVSLALVLASNPLVALDFDGELCVYELERGSLIDQTQIEDPGSYPTAVNDDGTKIAVGTDHSVSIYSTSTATLVDYYRVVDAGIFSVEFVPGTDTVIAGRGHGEILVFETNSDSMSSATSFNMMLSTLWFRD